MAPGQQATPEASAEAVQKLLDPHCLVAVTINPESRVKAARGPAPATLPRGRAVAFLVKVDNQAGMTHRITVTSRVVVRWGGPTRPDAWMEAELLPADRSARGLTGDRVEYLVLRMRSREAGKREATLTFDAGQGTQDLGFRAEVPILFTVGREQR